MKLFGKYKDSALSDNLERGKKLKDVSSKYKKRLKYVLKFPRET
jgi:hypothetical protein